MQHWVVRQSPGRAPGYSGDGGPAVQAQINASADEIGNTPALDAPGNLYGADGANVPFASCVRQLECSEVSWIE
jgi:hypothetical protein